MDASLIKKAEKRAYNTYEEIKRIKPVPTPKTVQEVAVERLAERELEKTAPKTGYPDLDKLIKGFIPGHLYTLTGDTNVGKTATACNFAINVAKQGKKVLYLTLEPGNNLVEYLASILYSKPYSEVTDEDIKLPGLELDVLGKDEVDSSERMVEIVESLDRYDLVVIDHVGYFITAESNAFLQQQSNTVKRFVSLAKKRQCAVVLIAHLRKKDKHQKRYNPTADDISGSAAFKQDSTEVLIVTRQMLTDDRDEIQYSNQGKIIVAKSKVGGNGVVNITFSTYGAKITSDGQLYDGNSADIVQSAREIFG